MKTFLTFLSDVVFIMHWHFNIYEKDKFCAQLSCEKSFITSSLESGTLHFKEPNLHFLRGSGGVNESDSLLVFYNAHNAYACFIADLSFLYPKEIKDRLKDIFTLKLLYFCDFIKNFVAVLNGSVSKKHFQ